MLNTIPKSGTYLYARLLERLGGVNAGVHLASGEFWDFRGRDMARIIAAPDDFKVSLPFAESVALVRPGQFVVGHIDRSDEAAEILRDFAHLFCVRDLRDVLVSHMRSMLDPRRRERRSEDWWQETGAELFAHYLRGPGGESFRHYILPVAAWRDDPTIISFRFESLMGDMGKGAQRASIERLCDAAQVTAHKALSVLTEVIGTPTRTYSGRRSSYADYESEEVSDLMAELGVSALNEALGYAPEFGTAA